VAAVELNTASIPVSRSAQHNHVRPLEHHADLGERLCVSPWIRDSVLAELTVEREQAAADKDRDAQRLVALTHERKAVLQAHYAGAMPLDLLKEEMERLTREMAEAERLAKDAGKTLDELDTTLRQALTVASNCHQQYLGAPPHVRRQINQGFFTKLFIATDGSVERVELTEPFATLMGDGLRAVAAGAQAAPDAPRSNRETSSTPTGEPRRDRRALDDDSVSPTSVLLAGRISDLETSRDDLVTTGVNKAGVVAPGRIRIRNPVGLAALADSATCADGSGGRSDGISIEDEGLPHS